MSTLSLSKYEALGNDFLVVFDEGTAATIDGHLARALCDRHRGVGADGLIRLVEDGPGTIRMELFNADGSPAETSGNGLRCAALASYEAGRSRDGAVLLETVAGPSPAVVEADPETGLAEVSVEMGRVTTWRAEEFDEAGMQGYRAEVGNPHLVLVAETLVGRDIAEIGPRLSEAVPGGQNVEVIAPATRERIDLVVYERGAGLTLACGSGSCAAAAVARRAGLVGDRVVVVNPGGELVVALEGEPAAPLARLRGPARRVARIEVDLPDGPPLRTDDAARGARIEVGA